MQTKFADINAKLVLPKLAFTDKKIHYVSNTLNDSYPKFTLVTLKDFRFQFQLL